jgi:bilirubin oxidase
MLDIRKITQSRAFKFAFVTFSLLATLLAILLYWVLFVRVTNAGLTFDNELRIPPEMKGMVNEDGVKVFDLRVEHGKMEFLSGQIAETLGVNGNYLGPTIRADRGDRVILNVSNYLKEDTTMHWHGMHVPAVMDGTPHQTISPGKMWTAEYEITQESGTMWYHPHTHGKTAVQVYHGIAGLFILDDENSKRIDIPDTYGDDDIPLIIQDRLFNEDGSLNYEIRRNANYGDTILVNGTYDPHVSLESRKIRFRILNGSNARIYWIGFDDEREFQQIATDGGFLDSPVDTTRVRIAPGERAEIVVDFSDGKDVILKSFPEAGLLETYSSWSAATTNGHFDLLEIRPQPASRNSHVIPKRLNRIARLERGSADVERTMAMGGMVINGKSMDMGRIDERIRLGDTEIWKIRNQTGRMHPFHVHLVQFLILDRNGRKPSAQESGWKDTVLVMPEERIDVIMKFDQHADPDVPYMYHCHILEHEDNGMMGQFVVVDE